MGSGPPSTVLQRLVEQCQGAVAGVLMGFDGTAETYYSQDLQLELERITCELTNVLKQINQTADILQVGTLTEMAVYSDVVNLLIRVIDPSRFMGLALRPGGNLGKGRFLLRMAAAQLTGESGGRAAPDVTSRAL